MAGAMLAVRVGPKGVAIENKRQQIDFPSRLDPQTKNPKEHHHHDHESDHHPSPHLSRHLVQPRPDNRPTNPQLLPTSQTSQRHSRGPKHPPRHDHYCPRRNLSRLDHGIAKIAIEDAVSRQYYGRDQR